MRRSPRAMPRTTVEPSAASVRSPRSRATTSATGRLSTRWPSIVRSRSPGSMPYSVGGAAGLYPGHLDLPVGGALRGDPDAGVRAVQGLLELLVLPLVVHRAPAVAAAADDLLGRLLAGLAVGHGPRGGVRHLVAVDGGGHGTGREGLGLPAAARQRTGDRGGGQYTGENQCQSRPAAHAAGPETLRGARHGAESRTTPPGRTAGWPRAQGALVTP